MRRSIERSFARLYVPDERDAKFKLKRLTTERTSRYWNDLRWQDADQGDTPHCVGFAAAGWLASGPVMQFLNPHGLYCLATYLDEWPETWETDEETGGGTSVRAVMKVLEHLGIITEYRWATSWKQALPHLMEKGPLVLGTSWYSDMCEPTPSGTICAEGELCGGHAYIVTGANTKTKMARIKNSWGDSWGIDGHAWISFEDLDHLIKEEGECCAGIEQKPTA